MTRSAASRLAWARRRQARERERGEVEAAAPSFLALWDAEGARFKSAEAFLEYAYANGSEVEAALEAQGERRLLREFRKLAARDVVASVGARGQGDEGEWETIDADDRDVDVVSDVVLAWECEENTIPWPLGLTG